MQHKRLKFGKGFRIALKNARGEAAEMVIPPDDAEGNPHNRHAGADQWLFVVSGSGRALVNGRGRALKKGDLLLIEKNDRHEIKNTGRSLLRTLNFYTPPAYDKDGRPNRRGKPSEG
ncbi:MAG TPA: cupin domain-containing protein [Rudaea sp.]|jgi:mannose-6-phosphate isomerase-like protein (cupin superfamily)|nr:cupin domain-containing protein [Rudaea sp.]